MPRTIQLSVPPAMTDRVISVAEKQAGLLGLQVQKGASLKPPGDIVTIRILNRQLHDLMRDLQPLDLMSSASASMVTTEMASVIATPRNDEIVSDSAEATWEEMEIMIAKEGNMTLNAMLVMAIAGAVAATGLMTGALHLVIAAMLVAPGFEPVVRISLSLASTSGTWRRGFIDVLKGYGALLLGAFAAVLLLEQLQLDTSAYLSSETLLRYWSTVSPASMFVTLVAGAAGAMLIVTNRSVLTAGVMVALALIPTPVIVAFAILNADAELAAGGAWRWLVEVILVLAASLAVFAWKRFRIQRRSITW